MSKLPASIERAIDRYSSARFSAGAMAEAGVGSSGDSPHREELQAAIAGAVREWQPAETAPRDGTHILAADFTPSDDGFGWFNGKRQPRMTVVHWHEWPGEYAGFWISCNAHPDQYEDETPWKFTHWMPLPEGPKP